MSESNPERAARIMQPLKPAVRSFKQTLDLAGVRVVMVLYDKDDLVCALLHPGTTKEQGELTQRFAWSFTAPVRRVAAVRRARAETAEARAIAQIDAEARAWRAPRRVAHG